MKRTIIVLAMLYCLPALAAPKKADVATDENAEAQNQVRKRLDDIWANFRTRDVARQESFHLYGPKFTEFKDGQPRGDAEANKKGEREIIAALSDPKIEMKDLAIAVYGDTAIATFNGDFSGKIGGKPVSMMEGATLVFVKYKGDWKIVHEHFSPLSPPPTAGK